MGAITFQLKINGLKLGTTIMFFTQGELFVKYQTELKKHFSGHDFFCVTYAHGTGAYIATKEAFVGNWLIITSGGLCAIIFGGLLIQRSFKINKNKKIILQTKII